MRHFLIRHYVCILFLLFILYNLVLDVSIEGPLYKCFMLMAIVENAFTLTKFRKEIKYKGSVSLCFFLFGCFRKICYNVSSPSLIL